MNRSSLINVSQKEGQSFMLRQDAWLSDLESVPRLGQSAPVSAIQHKIDRIVQWKVRRGQPEFIRNREHSRASKQETGGWRRQSLGDAEEGRLKCFPLGGGGPTQMDLDGSSYCIAHEI